MSRHRIFLLSPAHCGGERAKLLFRTQARFELAMQLRTPRVAPLGEVFRFLSGLYFRGKLAYSERFAIADTYAIPRPWPGAGWRYIEGALICPAHKVVIDPVAVIEEQRQ